METNYMADCVDVTSVLMNTQTSQDRRSDLLLTEPLIDDLGSTAWTPEARVRT